MEKTTKVTFNSADAIQELLTCGEIVLPQQILSANRIISADAYQEALVFLAAACQMRRGEPVEAHHFWFSGGYPSYTVEIRTKKIYVWKAPPIDADWPALWNNLIACFAGVKDCVTGLRREQYGDFQIQLFGTMDVSKLSPNTSAIKLSDLSSQGRPQKISVETLLDFIKAVESAFSFPGQVGRNEWDVELDYYDRDDLIATLGLRGEYSSPQERRRLSTLKAVRAGFVTTAKIPLPAVATKEEVNQA